MTNGELVSRVVNDIRALNKDEHVSRRYILYIARNKARHYLSQKLRDRSLFREDNLYRTIRCFGLSKEDVVRCDIVEFKRCKNLMRSRNKLPELIHSRYGNTVLSVTTVDGETSFLPITLSNYRLKNKRRFSKFGNQNYYYINDRYLYLPDSTVEVVDVTLLTLNEEDVEELSDCTTCNECKPTWDREFICSDKMIEIVIQETLQEVLSTFKQIIPDENPNLSQALRDRTERQ